ncbi:polynucleotide adenylyltransferase [Emydomyces testavorans]|uniref:polynucleotide adenylyltransferase n=1 Tax=Emydomyces testavorans TaxID=2070801 RepID=A0AAF0IIP6_9EURO|nr:polynucleotide adenylyltransferase [Emydomyces testavorans]
MPTTYEFRGNRASGRSRPQHEFTFHSRQPRTFARPLLMIERETTPEFLGTNDESEKQQPKFMNIEELTDSDEEAMDVSSAEDGEPPKKRQATEEIYATPSVVPKWSNPDPYTVLPPPDESQGKRKDFVKLIRKARIAAAQVKPEENNAIATNEDFISLGTDDLSMDQPPENAPRGPRVDRGGDPALGNRKRTRNDEIVGPARKTMRYEKLDMRFNMDGSIIQTWRALPGQDPSPWLDRLRPQPFHLGTILHNEIISFYRWVRPRPFEDVIRTDLITRLERQMQERFPGSQLHAFGSYASGLYLPVADVDLVLLSRSFIRQGKKYLCQKPKDIYSLTAFIRDRDIAIPGSIETIAHARVPIIKFVDRLTGLKVDLSFDNNSGLAANKTFQQWRAHFPAMPLIVSVVKQFLLFRGLNEVPTGGLGGFSIICLVTSLLQHLPHGMSDPNLGGVLMDFFDFYGNTFDFSMVGIELNPPGYFHKANSRDRLSIIDPNNCDNDIAVGTKEIRRIFKAFAEAFHTLRQNIASAALSPPQNPSLLASIIGGNYDSYHSQRAHLFQLYANHPRFVQYHNTVPLPAPQEEPTPPPPPPPSPPEIEASVSPGDNAFAAKPVKVRQKFVDRAARLKLLRPDLKGIPTSISHEQAMKLGGYSSEAEMVRDLNARERALEQ